MITGDEFHSIRDHDKTCDSISSIPAETINSINGTYICAKKGGKSFLDVTRVHPVTKRCPTGTTPCSWKTSPENTVCYRPEDHATSCPITGVGFFKKNKSVSPQLESYFDSYGGWTIKEAFPGYYIFYTRLEIDALPITKVKYTHKPCMDPVQAETYLTN